MSSHGNNQTHRLDCQTADHKSAAPRRVRKQHQRGKSEEESSGHYQQSGVLHGLSFKGLLTLLGWMAL
jgi:hypothetical protein